MKNTTLIFSIFFLLSCTKKLDLKPDSAIILPKTIKDMELILDNTTYMNRTPALAQISADEYFIPTTQLFQSLSNTTSRNAATWQKVIYDGEVNIQDWRYSYSCIFYSNNVLDILSSQDIKNSNEKNILKGWALFARSYAFYNLVSIFSKGYDPNTAKQDLGISLKLNASIDVIHQRNTVQETYDQIIKDLISSSELLQEHIIPGKRNRPSKVAAFAMLARVYLNMGLYTEAEMYAEKAIKIYPNLTDFNTLNKTAKTPFTYDTEETIYFSHLIPNYYELTYSETSLNYAVDQELIKLYDPSDLRLQIYFQKNNLGNYNTKPINTSTAVPFTGLATDELYLIKAECLARRGETDLSMNTLNQLLIKRWDPSATTPSIPYQNLTAQSAEIALKKILIERRKALIWRGIRWTDLKRLNLEGRNISIHRKIGDKEYHLEPNSSKYVLPIPDDEVALSGVLQNLR